MFEGDRSKGFFFFIIFFAGDLEDLQGFRRTNSKSKILLDDMEGENRACQPAKPAKFALVN